MRLILDIPVLGIETLGAALRREGNTFCRNVMLYVKSRGKPASAARAIGVRAAVIVLIGLAASGLRAQPSFTAPAPVPSVIEDAAERRTAYLARAQEAVMWRAGLAKPENPATLGL